MHLRRCNYFLVVPGNHKNVKSLGCPVSVTHKYIDQIIFYNSWNILPNRQESSTFGFVEWPEMAFGCWHKTNFNNRSRCKTLFTSFKARWINRRSNHSFSETTLTIFQFYNNINFCVRGILRFSICSEDWLSLDNLTFNQSTRMAISNQLSKLSLYISFSIGYQYKKNTTDCLYSL